MLHNQPDRFLTIGAPKKDSKEVVINLYDLITQALKTYQENRLELWIQFVRLLLAFEKGSGSGPIDQFKVDLNGLDRLGDELDPETQSLLIEQLGPLPLNRQPDFD